MGMTKEQIKALLNQLQNDPSCRYDLDYFSEKNPDPYIWKAVLEGTQGSIYEDGFYMIKITFNSNYPESRPDIQFLNKIFHPHVHSSGTACIVPSKNDIISVLETVESMFLDYDADVDHAYGEEPRQLFESNPDKFVEKAKEWVKVYAKLEDLDQFYD